MPGLALAPVGLAMNNSVSFLEYFVPWRAAVLLNNVLDHRAAGTAQSPDLNIGFVSALIPTLKS